MFKAQCWHVIIMQIFVRGSSKILKNVYLVYLIHFSPMIVLSIYISQVVLMKYHPKMLNEWNSSIKNEFVFCIQKRLSFFSMESKYHSSHPPSHQMISHYLLLNSSVLVSFSSFVVWKRDMDSIYFRDEIDYIWLICLYIYVHDSPHIFYT